jgi:hypothetical protein
MRSTATASKQQQQHLQLTRGSLPLPSPQAVVAALPRITHTLLVSATLSTKVWIEVAEDL